MENKSNELKKFDFEKDSSNQELNETNNSFVITKKNFNNKGNEEKLFTICDNTQISNQKNILLKTHLTAYDNELTENMKVRQSTNNEFYYKGTIDSFINQVTFNFYTFSAFLIFSLLIMIDGGEMTVISLLVSRLGESWNLSNFEKGVMGASVFLGFFAGTLISGKVSDISGRKPIFLIGNFLVCVFAIASAFSPNYAWFTIFRGFCGFGVGLALPSSAALSAEICPAQYRGILINILTIFFPIGEILTAIIAKSLLKENPENGWRYLLAIISFPMLIAFLVSIFIRESPRFLANNKEFNQAYKEIEILLGKKLTEIEKNNIKQEINLASENVAIESNYTTLFTQAYLRLNMSVCFLFFSCSFIYYGVVYVLPEGLELNYNSTISNYKNITNNIINSSNTDINSEEFPLLGTNEFNSTGTKKIDLDNVFNGVIYSALSEIPSPIIAMLLVNIKFLGRKYSIVVGFICVSIFSLFCVYFNYQLVIFASLLKFSINIPFSICYLYVSEVFPTKIRSIAIGFSNSFNRIGGIITPIVSQFLFYHNKTFPYIIYFALSIIAIFLGISLPIETYGRILE